MKRLSTLRNQVRNIFILTTFFLVITISSVFSYTVTNLAATYQSGQVFLTWTDPNVQSLQYNVYCSSSPFTSSSQLTSASFLGFVRDSSSKNIFWSQQSGEDVFFKIQNSAAPL